jgi:hypothetical protein
MEPVRISRYPPSSAFIKETSDSALAVGDWNLAANPRLGLSKHRAKYVGKYVQKCLQPRSLVRRHVCGSLHLDLHLDINLDLRLLLHRALLAKFYPQLLKSFLESLLGSMFAAKRLWLQVPMRLALYRQMLLPGRPVGRGVVGRIVVELRPTTTYGWQSGPFLLPLLPEERVGVRSPANRRLWRVRTYAQDRLLVKALAPELRRSLRHSAPRSAADSMRDSSPHSTRD